MKLRRRLRHRDADVTAAQHSTAEVLARIDHALERIAQATADLKGPTDAPQG